MTRRSCTFIAVFVSMLYVASSSFIEDKPAVQVANEIITTAYHNNLRAFDSGLREYPKYFMDSSYPVRLLKYHELIYQYKQIEGFYSYFHPKDAYGSFMLTPRFQARDFGPPLPDNWLWLGPFGIDPDSVASKFLGKDSAFTKMFIERSVKNFRQLLLNTGLNKAPATFSEVDVFDALRKQIVYISTISIANGDLVIEDAGMAGLEGAMDAWASVLKVYANYLPRNHDELKMRLNKKLHAAMALLDTKPDFREFDRMNFLTEHLIPLSTAFNELQRALNIPLKKESSALNNEADHIYAENALDVDYFIPTAEAKFNAAKAELGKLLFFDPILSDNNERACASCHKPDMAFADGNKTSISFEREKNLPRNAPTVINAVFQKRQFWDMRAGSLEDQLDSVVNNRDELHSSFENVIDRINSSPQYVSLFHQAFPDSKVGGIERRHVTTAIAVYERLLTGTNSRFDKYVRGDKSQLNQSEVNGFNLFMGKAKCGTCHFAPIFNGALPPYFDSTEHRSLGIPVKDTMDVYVLDADTGFSRVTRSPFNHFSFKVPTVRNVELTAPYMHNGVYQTLEQVVNFYDHAGGNKFWRDMRPGTKNLPFFMILPEQLKLSEAEKKDVVNFMRSLTDNSAAKHVPTKLPTLTGKYAALNDRILGGIY